MKKGFTLTEMIIVLGIVGIIAGLTIPALITNYNNKVFVSELKRVCSEIDLAAKQAIADEEANADNFEMPNINHETGEVVSEVDENANIESGFYSTNAGMSTSNAEQGARYFLNTYFKHVDTNCGQRCMAKSYKNPHDNINNVAIIAFPPPVGSGEKQFYCIKLFSGSSLCMAYRENAMVGIIDVNGPNAPNRVGKDLFVLRISNNGDFEDFSPNSEDCNVRNDEYSNAYVNFASGCLSKVINNGWVIRD